MHRRTKNFVWKRVNANQINLEQETLTVQPQSETKGKGATNISGIHLNMNTGNPSTVSSRKPTENTHETGNADSNRLEKTSRRIEYP